MFLDLRVFSFLSVFSLLQGFVIKEGNVDLETAVQSFYGVCTANPDKCFVETEGCQQSQNCPVAVAFEENEDNSYTFYGIGIPPADSPISYVAFGFAEQKAGMGPGSVVQCVGGEKDTVQLYVSYNKAIGNGNDRYDITAGKVDLLESAYIEDSLIFCKFTIEPGTVFGSKSLFAGYEESYFVIGASGPANETNIQSHRRTGNSCRSKERITFKTPENSVITNLYSLCSNSPETCAGAQDGCIANQNCSIIVGYELTDNNYTFYAATTKTNEPIGYVALGFADQSGMGPGSVVQCVNEEDGSVKLYNAILTSENSRRDEEVNGLELLESSFTGTLLFCKFTIAQRSTFGDRMLFSKSEEKYFLLGAAGPANKTAISYHHKDFSSTPDQISFKIKLEKGSSSQIQPILVLFFIMQLLVNKFM